MSDEILALEKAGVTTMVLPGGSAAFSVQTSGLSEPDPGDKKKRAYNISGDWVIWGKDNRFPEHVMADLRESTVAKRILDRRASIHVGAGLYYYTIDIDEGGKRIKRPLYIPEIEDFMDMNNSFTVQKQLANDLETFFNAMPVYSLNTTKTKIAGLSFRKMFHTRIGKPNEKSHKVEHVCYSYNWPNPSAEKKEIKTYDIFNPLKPLAKTHTVTPLRYNTSDECLFYELAIWDGIRQNGFLDIEILVPKLKKHIFQNQAILKYHVKIPYDYWTRKYGKEEWIKMNKKSRDAAVASELEKMDEFLSGVKNSGKSFISFYGHDPITGKPFPGFEISAIDNKLKSDDYLPDASAAITAVCFAMGYDPTNMGSVMADKRGSGGSGSDKREALANLQSSMLVDRYVSLEPMRLITRVNKWNEVYKNELGGKRIHWGYLDVDNSHTLDQKTPNDRVPGQSKEEIHNG